MIFGRDLVSCDDFDDCHDKIVVVGIDFIGRRSICDHYLQGKGRSQALPMRTVTLGHRSHHQWPRRGIQGLGDESASYVVPDDATINILSSIQMRFGLDLTACSMF